MHGRHYPPLERIMVILIMMIKEALFDPKGKKTDKFDEHLGSWLETPEMKEKRKMDEEVTRKEQAARRTEAAYKASLKEEAPDVV